MPPSVAQQAARNQEIVTARLRNLSWATIAATYGLTDRRCRQIFAEWRENNPTLRHDKAVEIVDYLLDSYRGAIEELALVANTTTNDAVRVGAINSRLNALGKVAALLQEVGALPHDLGELRVQIDAQYTIERIVSVLTRHNNVPVEVLRELSAVLTGGDPSQN